MFKIIAAKGLNNELGYNNDLIWHLPEDLKFFKEVTSNHTIVMGENTFFSLPRLLPNRKHIVLSQSGKEFPDEVIVYNDFNKFLEDYKNKDEDIFVIGGGMIYKLFIDYADELYLTEIEDSFNEATVYFPEFDKDLFTKEILCEHDDNNIKYKHVLYRRK